MSDSARLVFLGGMGEIGRNMIVVEDDESLLVVDAGLSFPTDEMPGVDLVLPDFSYVRERAEKCVGVLLTHGHEDHVGALSWLLQEIDAPVFGTPLTLGIARRRLDEHGVSAEEIEVVAPGSRRIGSFGCDFLTTSHSIPDSIAVAIATGGGRVLYTSDFKIDQTPIDGRKTDLLAFADIARRGVDVLLSDSTNSERPGRTPSEAIVGGALNEIFTAAEGRIVVACFASNLHRIQQACHAAELTGRKVAFAGRSMVANVEVGRELGHISVASGTIVDIDALDSQPNDGTVVVCTGSQGEPFSALSLIAAGDHKFVHVDPGDTVILSATPIPGNESAVHRVINGLCKAGADVYHPGLAPVHVSGHAAADELAEMISLVKPKVFVPVHGEYRQLATHARIAESSGVGREAILIVEDGDTIELSGGVARRGERVNAGTVLVDGLGVGDVGPVVLRDRTVLSRHGVVICVVTIDATTGEVLAGPDLITRGFVFEAEARDLLNEAADQVADALADLEREGVTDWGAIKKVCRRALGEFVWAQTRRRPMIMPIVMEV